MLTIVVRAWCRRRTHRLPSVWVAGMPASMRTSRKRESALRLSPWSRVRARVRVRVGVRVGVTLTRGSG